jgi:CubicO group peptidase (beta-lactamase class C family)
VCHLGAPLDPARFEARVIEGLNRAAAAAAAPGPQVYSDLGFLLLGLALARAAGKNLSDQYDTMCREDLGLANRALPLAYGTTLDLATRAIPTADCAVRGRLLQGEVHDENCASLGGVTAHSGLFGTGGAVARFLHALAASPLGMRLLADNAEARRLPPGEPPNESLLGWRQGADPSSSPFGDGAAMGHMGFTGVAFWVWPERRAYAIFLTNRVIGGRTRPGIAAARREVFSALSPAARPD